MSTAYGNSTKFIGFILENTCHNISSLSEILTIPKSRLLFQKKLTRNDKIKIQKLQRLLEKNC